jgi:hypothetical protein
MDVSNGYVSNTSAPLNIQIDRTSPPAPAPDLAEQSDRGLSNSDDITNDNTPTFVGTTEPNSIVTLYRGAVGNTVLSDASGAWSITPTINSDGSHSLRVQVEDPAGNTSVLSPPTTIRIDTVSPTLTSPIAFYYETAPHKVKMEFSDDVIATLAVTDLTVFDLSTGGTVGVTLAYDQPQHAATFSFSGVLPRGNYRATLNPAGVTDIAGNGVVGATSLDFFFLPGDANHDGTVNVSDLGTLATNWQGTDKTFSQGDFSYDGRVDVVDLGILASNWQQSLALPSAPFVSHSSSQRTRAMIDQVIM